MDLDLALEVIPFFRLKRANAEKVIQEVKTAVAGWRAVAAHLKIPKQQIESKARAFQIAHI
jgi:serine/threonine-protein kinase HipA